MWATFHSPPSPLPNVAGTIGAIRLHPVWLEEHFLGAVPRGEGEQLPLDLAPPGLGGREEACGRRHGLSGVRLPRRYQGDRFGFIRLFWFHSVVFGYCLGLIGYIEHAIACCCALPVIVFGPTRLYSVLSGCFRLFFVPAMRFRSVLFGCMKYNIVYSVLLGCVRLLFSFAFTCCSVLLGQCYSVALCLQKLCCPLEVRPLFWNKLLGNSVDNVVRSYIVHTRNSDVDT